MSTAPPPVFQFDIVLERYYLREVLKALVHSVLFYRGFQSIRPIDVDLDSLDVTFVRVDDSQIEQLVQDKISTLSQTLESTNAGKGKLAVLMCEKQRRGTSPLRPVSSGRGSTSATTASGGSGGWFGLGSTSGNGTQPETSCWEQWIFSFTLTQARGEREELEARKRMATDLQGLLELISTRSLEGLEHVPPLTTSDAFPFQIVTSPQTDQSWTSMLRQMISS